MGHYTYTYKYNYDNLHNKDNNHNANNTKGKIMTLLILKMGHNR